MGKTITQNRKARHDYHIEDEYEAGIMLLGPEVKSLRNGHCSIAESYVSIVDGEAFLVNSHIDPYDQATGGVPQEPRRRRKLLLHKREIEKLFDKSQKGGYTIIALTIYFNDRSVAKVKIATAKGKQKHDKREAEKRRDWDREKTRLDV